MSEEMLVVPMIYIPCHRREEKLVRRKFKKIGVIGNEGEERHKGRVIVDERQAILGKNGLIKLIYPNEEQRRDEAHYLRKFSGMCGVPWLYESSKNYNIVEQVNPLPDGIYKEEVLCVLTYQICDLIETLWRQGIVHGRIRYFTMQKEGRVYFVDCVDLQKASDRNVRKDLLSMVSLVNAHSDLDFPLNMSNLGKDLREIIEETDNLEECFCLIRGRCWWNFDVTHESILPW